MFYPNKGGYPPPQSPLQHNNQHNRYVNNPHLPPPPPHPHPNNQYNHNGLPPPFRPPSPRINPNNSRAPRSAPPGVPQGYNPNNPNNRGNGSGYRPHPNNPYNNPSNNSPGPQGHPNGYRGKETNQYNNPNNNNNNRKLVNGNTNGGASPRVMGGGNHNHTNSSNNPNHHGSPYSSTHVSPSQSPLPGSRMGQRHTRSGNHRGGGRNSNNNTNNGNSNRPGRNVARTLFSQSNSANNPNNPNKNNSNLNSDLPPFVPINASNANNPDKSDNGDAADSALVGDWEDMYDSDHDKDDHSNRPNNPVDSSSSAGALKSSGNGGPREQDSESAAEGSSPNNPDSPPTRRGLLQLQGLSPRALRSLPPKTDQDNSSNPNHPNHPNNSLRLDDTNPPSNGLSSSSVLSAHTPAYVASKPSNASVAPKVILRAEATAHIPSFHPASNPYSSQNNTPQKAYRNSTPNNPRRTPQQIWNTGSEQVEVQQPSYNWKARESANNPNNPGQQPTVERLQLSYDTPVVGCPLNPYVLVKGMDGNSIALPNKPPVLHDSKEHKNNGGGKGFIKQGTLTGSYTWSQGEIRRCNVLNCESTAVLECLSCTKYQQLLTARLNLLNRSDPNSPNGSPSSSNNNLKAICEQLLGDYLSNKVMYCSTVCMAVDWHSHKHIHTHLNQQFALLFKNSPNEPSPSRLFPGFSEDTTDKEKIEHDSEPKAHLGAPDQAIRDLFQKFPRPHEQKWRVVGTNKQYEPSEADVGRALRIECVPSEYILTNNPNHPGNKKVLLPVPGVYKRLETAPVARQPLPPPARTMHYHPNNPNSSDNPNGSKGKFAVFNYNVLAQLLATPRMYHYTPGWALTWEYRRKVILREILQHGRDIIALQEVQANHFENFFLPELSKRGFSGVFKKKTRAVDDERTIDGCALFVRKERFSIKEQYGIDFDNFAREMAGKSRALRRLQKGNIGMFVVVFDHLKQRLFCIANVHTYWNPEFADVKLWQTWVLCRELEKLVLPRGLPLLLCGDFNSTPDSAVYGLLANAHVPNNDEIFYPNNDPENIIKDVPSLRHQLGLRSAYSSVMGSEPLTTNFTEKFTGVLDYIWYSQSHLVPSAVLDVPSPQILQKHTALPSPLYPSDHVCLLCHMEWLD